MHIEECFRILDVAPTASEAEIRKAYRTLVNVWHPDRFADREALRAEAERKLTTINEAFRTLELAGFPRGSLAVPQQHDVATESITVPSQPLSRSVHGTIWATSSFVLTSLFWLVADDQPLAERTLVSVFAGLLAGTFVSNIVFHVVWSVKRRPRTWVLLVGGLVVLTAMILDLDPSLAPVLTVIGFLGSMLFVFILFYLRSRSGQT